MILYIVKSSDKYLKNWWRIISTNTMSIPLSITLCSLSVHSIAIRWTMPTIYTLHIHYEYTTYTFIKCISNAKLICL